MIYKIDDKFYIKVQGYYKEVSVKTDGDNLDISLIPDSETIEVYGFEKVVVPFDTTINKEELIQILDTPKKFGSRNKEEHSRYRSRD